MSFNPHERDFVENAMKEMGKEETAQEWREITK